MTGTNRPKIPGIFAILLCGAFLSACITGQPGSPFSTSRAPAAGGVASGRPAETALVNGKKHFQNGDYGLAEKYFRKAVETSAANSHAWLGLAASYDHLQRFKLSRRAYDQAIKLSGKTPAILNNLGYSHLLQGNLKKARHYFVSAYKKAPENMHIRNNLALLRASEKRA